MAEEAGRKLAGAMRKSPTMAGLTRIGPGMYRDKSGKVVGAQGQKLAQITPQQSMAQREQQSMGQPQQSNQPISGMGGMIQNPQGVTPEMGQASGMGGMYTKPAIIAGPGGGEPTRNFMPFQRPQAQDAMYRLPGTMPNMSREEIQGTLNQMAENQMGQAGAGGPVYAAQEAAPQPMPERRTMPSVGFIGRNFMGRQYNR